MGARHGGYDLSLEAADQGLLARLGERLGLVDRNRPLALSWEEPGPERPSAMLRHVAVELPDVDPGDLPAASAGARSPGAARSSAATEVEIRREAALTATVAARPDVDAFARPF